MNAEYELPREQRYAMGEIKLSDRCPKVTFDVDLAKRLAEGEVIGYDPDSLDTLLEKMAVDDEKRDLTIHIGKSGIGTKGYYDFESNRIVIEYNDSLAKMDEVLRHEMQHHADGLQEPSTAYKIGTRACRSMAFIGPAVIAVNVIGGYLAQQAEVIPPELIGGLCLANTTNLGAMAISLLYIRNPAEVRARKAERSKHTPVFVREQAGL